MPFSVVRCAGLIGLMHAFCTRLHDSTKADAPVDFGRQVEFGVSTDVDWCPLPRASVGDAQRPACRDPPRDGEPLLAVRG
jgi:hypothetical protein